jgi:hypothetical protein
MVASPTCWDTPQLSGRTRHRRSLLGKMVLQVEERHRRVTLYGPGYNKYGAWQLRWRDATFEDLYQLNNGATSKVDGGTSHG